VIQLLGHLHRKPPERHSHPQREKKRHPLRLVFVLRLDLLLLLHGGLFACIRLGEWRRGVPVLVRQSVPHLRHL
jgi:hypothetical protein